MRKVGHGIKWWGVLVPLSLTVLWSAVQNPNQSLCTGIFQAEVSHRNLLNSQHGLSFILDFPSVGEGEEEGKEQRLEAEKSIRPDGDLCNTAMKHRCECIDAGALVKAHYMLFSVPIMLELEVEC